MAQATPQIPEQIKVFIVNALAAFDTPSVVAEAVKREFEYDVSRQAVEAHDPTKVAGGKLSAKWRTLFEAARAAFIEDSTSIPIAHRSTRLRALWRMAERAEKAGNLGLAAQLHKQAAEEMGNAYTNRREVTGRGGKDLVPPTPATVIVLPDNGRG